MNPSEEVAYWYLRLNGFFLLPNFVVHPEGHQAGDVDVLGIRPPHVTEHIGGRTPDTDPLVLRLFPDGRWGGAICEVKSGPRPRGELFPAERLEAAVLRLGVAGENTTHEILERLAGHRDFTNDQCTIKKLLFAWRQFPAEEHFVIELGYALAFVRQRIDEFFDEKSRDRMFFPHGLFNIQIEQLRLAAALEEEEY